MNAKLRLGTPEEAGMSASRVEHVIELAEGWVEQGIHPALVILVARRGVIVIHEAFGRLTPEQDSPPVELDTIFHLASITKPITATLVMLLVEDGLVGLNRPVQSYIPEFVSEGKNKAMVHHLLTHTSGIKDELDHEYLDRKKGTMEITPSTKPQHPLIDAMYDAPLWKLPGVQMHYSSHGIMLAGEIVERVSGMPLDDFARERVFDPLKMKDTFYVVPESLEHRIAKPPDDVKGAGFDLLRSPGIRAAAGIHSTAMDTAIFGQMFLNRGSYGDVRILSPASVVEMTRNQIPGISARWGDEVFPEASWGFGWGIHGSKKNLSYEEPLQSPETFAHGGAGGVRLWIDPVYEVVEVFFSVELAEDKVCADLFINSVTAAVVD
jgi:CubicO group peptidase (beta-lactamase class C family)